MTAVPGRLDGDTGELLDALHREYPAVMSWRGQFTGTWWALLGGHLVEAPDAVGLARLIREHLPHRAMWS
ncbi:hypothetical protein [Actinomadura rupiterrae]|uniref:hypothetical protein n=1 Tax=Actinomadura rupiterrae TaxID=559627 RepID=UPI0020A4088D|nr:hypothetical protein [Actinomadura rupiterrae]MCP2336130.1 hypothetical protein [Actinomadura rupiterrae]